MCRHFGHLGFWRGHFFPVPQGFPSKKYGRIMWQIRRQVGRLGLFGNNDQNNFGQKMISKFFQTFFVLFYLLQERSKTYALHIGVFQMNSTLVQRPVFFLFTMIPGTKHRSPWRSTSRSKKVIIVSIRYRRRASSSQIYTGIIIKLYAALCCVQIISKLSCCSTSQWWFWAAGSNVDFRGKRYPFR